MSVLEVHFALLLLGARVSFVAVGLLGGVIWRWRH